MINLEYAHKIQGQENRSREIMLSQLHYPPANGSKVAMLMSRYNYWQAQYRAYLGNKCSSEFERKQNLKAMVECRKSAQQALTELKEFS